MSDKKILNKIKKLLALAKSTNPHEAANALRMAQKLMQENSLSQTDIELLEIQMESVRDVNQAQSIPTWSAMLARAVADAFGLDVIRARPALFSSYVMQFVGPAERVEIGSYCYMVLGRKLVKARSEFLKSLNKRLKKTSKIARVNLFAIGWIQGVMAQVEKLVPNEKEQALIKQFQEREFGELTTTKTRHAKATARDQDAGWAGYQQGRQVQLNAGVSGAEQGKLEHKTL